MTQIALLALGVIWALLAGAARIGVELLTMAGAAFG
jgi:hypothetical protein